MPSTKANKEASIVMIKCAVCTALLEKRIGGQSGSFIERLKALR